MIEPLKHRILIQRDAPKVETESGLHIPKIAVKEETRGTVLAVGLTADSELKIGQRVLFGLHDGFKVDPKYCDDLENCWMIADNQVRLIFNDV